MLTWHPSLSLRMLPAALLIVPFTLYAGYIAWLVVPARIRAVVPAVIEAVVER